VQFFYKCEEIMAREAMPKGAYLGEFEQHVLAALLRLRNSAYGVTIRREIVGRTGRDVAVGAIYATLDRLEAKGYVTSRVGEATPERGGRAKRYFDIEAPGLTALEESWRMTDRMRDGMAPVGVPGR
jgi:PadR family transcriptional regulator, regulatory protein PadR